MSAGGGIVDKRARGVIARRAGRVTAKRAGAGVVAKRAGGGVVEQSRREYSLIVVMRAGVVAMRLQAKGS